MEVLDRKRAARLRMQLQQHGYRLVRSRQPPDVTLGNYRYLVVDSTLDTVVYGGWPLAYGATLPDIAAWWAQRRSETLSAASAAD